ncbi:MAG TPA: PEP/pyruvate-binding domain-containing protein [Candidatus Melainabacteria bacterium]|nr:PEP/pyruvate-binding domain-containing protein [Candidatus Melainabacteria bacterium]
MNDKNCHGGKAENLRKMQEHGFNIPPFLVLSGELLNETLQESFTIPEVESGDNSLELAPIAFDTEDLDEEAMSTFLTSLEEDKIFVETLQKKVVAELEQAAIADDSGYAVRSSARQEDGGTHSYAGQLDSFLRVKERELALHVIKVWRSAYSERVSQYRRLNGEKALAEIPSVIIQVMIEADLAGVAFGADPRNGDLDCVVINAVSGTAEKLVDGTAEGALYVLKAGKIKEITNEEKGFLRSFQIKQIEKATLALGKFFEHPQDIEWVIKENRLFIVQSRAITTLAKNASHGRRVDIFDNSNIAESYPGVTTPLTFSFARVAYENVYLEFARLMGVKESLIQKNAFIFPQMLGYINGRIYYNLLNWYRLLALFPGYKTNSAFMEQMMGVKEPPSPEYLDKEEKSSISLSEKAADLLSFCLSLAGILYRYLTLPLSIKRFEKRLESSLESVPENLESLTAVELALLYRRLEVDLLKNWDAPLINDFFAMICFGLSRKLSASWLSDESLFNKLLCGETGIVSTEPNRLIVEMSRLVNADSALEKAVKEADLVALRENNTFNSLFEEYLRRFGDRSAGELKLETRTLKDNPAPILDSVLAVKENSSDSTNSNSAKAKREEAEAQLIQEFEKSPIKNLVYRALLKETRTRIKYRENLRYERTRVFGIVRGIFRALGKKLQESGYLNAAQDVFYLEVEEVLRFVEGTATTTNLKALTEARICEAAAFPALSPDRITCFDGANLGRRETETAQTPLDMATLTGLGACPGIIRGRVKVLVDPNKESLDGNEILVAERTDPGWITVISQAKAVVVEYGSLLSHTAIVARELGIPTIVSLKNATKALVEGDLVEVDGGTGRLTILESASDSKTKKIA